MTPCLDLNKSWKVEDLTLTDISPSRRSALAFVSSLFVIVACCTSCLIISISFLSFWFCCLNAVKHRTEYDITEMILAQKKHLLIYLILCL